MMWPTTVVRAVTAVRANRWQAGLLTLFLFSGIAALIYQISWQRMLFAALGSDIESITIIISNFMVGLGIGAVLGGIVADRHPGHALRIFWIIEMAIGDRKSVV